MKITKEKKQEAIDRLKELYPRGSTVYTVMRHVSQSGMMRVIGLLAITANETGGIEIFHPNYFASIALGNGLDKREGVRVQGAGMDMGYYIVFRLSDLLYDDGFALNHRWV